MATDVPTRHRAPSAIRRAHPVGTTQPATVAGQHGLSQFLPALALVGVAVVWGVTFSVVDLAVIGVLTTHAELDAPTVRTLADVRFTPVDGGIEVAIADPD